MIFVIFMYCCAWIGFSHRTKNRPTDRQICQFFQHCCFLFCSFFFPTGLNVKGFFFEVVVLIVGKWLHKYVGLIPLFFWEVVIFLFFIILTVVVSLLSLFLILFTLDLFYLNRFFFCFYLCNYHMLLLKSLFSLKFITNEHFKKYFSKYFPIKSLIIFLKKYF